MLPEAIGGLGGGFPHSRRRLYIGLCMLTEHQTLYVFSSVEPCTCYSFFLENLENASPSMASSYSYLGLAQKSLLGEVLKSFFSLATLLPSLLIYKYIWHSFKSHFIQRIKRTLSFSTLEIKSNLKNHFFSSCKISSCLLKEFEKQKSKGR